jgi:hypothetical protein
MYGGSVHLNHNQTVAKQGLRVKSNIKAGPSGSGTYSGSTLLNHNQTVLRGTE